MFENDGQNYYNILDVKPDATQNEIRQAYFRAKAAYGKDSAALYSLFDESQTRHVLESIEQAYLVLSNPEKRKEYDKVHGFLKNDETLPLTKKAPSHANVFNFAKNSESSADPAQQAARNVFGPSAEIGDSQATSAQATGVPAGNTPAPTRREEPLEDYSTPRTLAAHSAAGPPTQDYSSFNQRENRLGLVRRIDLVKPYEKNNDMEESITAETQFRGEFLRKVRLYKGIAIEELAEFTKISKSYINCIESEEFEGLPAPAYLRGFVMQIAKALKLPHEKAANAYMVSYKNTVLIK